MAELSKIVYAMIAIVAVFAILFTWQSNLIVSYNKELPNEYNETFQLMSNMKNISDQVGDYKELALSESNEDASPFSQFVDIIGKYFERGVKIIQLVPNMLNLIDTMLQSILGSNVNLLGIAVTPLNFLVIIGLTAIITFAIISILLRYNV